MRQIDNGASAQTTMTGTIDRPRLMARASSLRQ